MPQISGLNSFTSNTFHDFELSPSFFTGLNSNFSSCVSFFEFSPLQKLAWFERDRALTRNSGVMFYQGAKDTSRAPYLHEFYRGPGHA